MDENVEDLKHLMFSIRNELVFLRKLVTENLSLSENEVKERFTAFLKTQDRHLLS